MEIKSNFNYDLMTTNSSGIHGHLNLNHQNLRLTASVPILTSQQQQQQDHQLQQIQSLLRNTTNNRTGTGGSGGVGDNNSISEGNLASIPPHLLQNLQQESIDISDSRPHICQLCRASYKTRTHLRRHMYIHLSNRPFPCPHDGCSKGFNRKEHLNKHIEAVHSGTKYKCNFCSKEISRKDHLSRHIKNIHFAPQVNKGDLEALKVQANCNSGGGSNPNKQAKAQVQITFVNPAPVGFSTSNRQQQQQQQQQNTTAKQSKGNRNHNIQNSNNNNNSNNINGNTSLQLQYIVNNSNSGGNGNNMLIQNIPITQFQLNNQNQNAGNGGTKTSQSQQHRNNTNNMITVNGVVNYHQQQQNLKSLSQSQNVKPEKVEKPQPYKCQECPRAYTRREKLTEHIRCFHQGQKFACEYCHKELSRKDHVLRHVRSVHPEVLANRFVAIAESGGLDQNVNQNQNQINVQGGSQQQQQNNSQQGGNSRNSTNIPSMGEMGVLLRSVCHICLKVFGTSYHLSRHMESLHNGDVRPYACTACSKQFKRKDHLTKHIKSHCASMRDSTLSSPVSRKSGGVRPNTNNTNNNSSQNSNTNSVSGGGIHHQNLDGDYGSIPIESLPLQIEMMDEEGHSVDSSDDQDPSSRNKSDFDTTERDFNMAVSSFLGESTKNMMEKNLSNALSSNLQQQNQQQQQQQQQVNNGLLISSANNILNQQNPPNSSNNSSSNNNGIINLPNFSCGHCNESFLDRAKLITHLNQHNNEHMPSSGGSGSNIWTH